MVKSSDAIDIRPAAEWLTKRLVPADEQVWVKALFAADTNNDGFLEKTEFATYTSNPLTPHAPIEENWSQCKNTFLKFGVWQYWRMANAHLMANSGQPKTTTQICSDLSQEVGPPFYGPSTTGFSARVFCGYTQSAKFWKSDKYEVLAEQFLNLPRNNRLHALQTELKNISGRYLYRDRQGSNDDLYTVIEIGAGYLTAADYTTFLTDAMQNPNAEIRERILADGVRQLSAAERIPFFQRALEDSAQSVSFREIAHQLKDLPEKDRLHLVTVAMHHRSSDVRFYAVQCIRDLPMANRMSLVRQGMEDGEVQVRRGSVWQCEYLKEADQLTILQMALKDSDRLLHYTAFDYLGYRPKAVIIPVLIQALRDSEVCVRLRALEAAQSLAPADREPILAAAQWNLNADVRAEAIAIKNIPQQRFHSSLASSEKYCGGGGGGGAL